MRQIPLFLLAAVLCAGEGPSAGGPPPQGGDKRPPGPSPEEMFQKADANKDGKVTLEELTAAIEARRKGEREGIFAKMDANGDGSISKEEFLAFEPPAPPTTPGQGGDEGRKPRRGGPDPAELFKRLDRNGDGVITADEVKRPEHPKGGSEGGGPPSGEHKPVKPAKDDPLE